MMERYDIICGDMWRSKNGDYVRYLEARAEIERLTKERDEALAAEAEYRRKNHALTNERDKARAQVAAAYEAAERALEARKYGDPDERGEYAFDAALDKGIVAIRALIPAHAQAALEAYGREKVREGMKRAADAIENRCYDDPALAGHGFIALIHDAILAAMEKEGGE